MMRTLLILFALLPAAMADGIGDGYLATSNGTGDERVVAFGLSKPREYFETTFLAEAPHTRNLAAKASSIKASWKLVGYFEGRAIYDLVHSGTAHGGAWAVKTILFESENGLFRPVFSRETQPGQWPVTDTFFSFADGSLALVDRYRENARISGPFGHVILARKDGWVVDGFSKHPLLFKND